MKEMKLYKNKYLLAKVKWKILEKQNTMRDDKY